MLFISLLFFCALQGTPAPAARDKSLQAVLREANVEPRKKGESWKQFLVRLVKTNHPRLNIPNEYQLGGRLDRVVPEFSFEQEVKIFGYDKVYADLEREFLAFMAENNLLSFEFDVEATPIE